MEVIKAALLDWHSLENCEHCQSELKVELSDLKREQGFDQRDNESWDYATFVCAVCKRCNRLKSYASVPAHIRDRIPS